MEYNLKKAILEKNSEKDIAKLIKEIKKEQRKNEKILEKKLPERYKFLAKHAINLTNFAVGFIPYSKIIDVIKTFMSMRKIQLKQEEQKRVIKNIDESITLTELKAALKEEESELNKFYENQEKLKLKKKGVLKFKSELQTVLEDDFDEERMEEKLLRALFKDLIFTIKKLNSESGVEQKIRHFGDGKEYLYENIPKGKEQNVLFIERTKSKIIIRHLTFIRQILEEVEKLDLIKQKRINEIFYSYLPKYVQMEKVEKSVLLKRKMETERLFKLLNEEEKEENLDVKILSVNRRIINVLTIVIADLKERSKDLEKKVKDKNDIISLYSNKKEQIIPLIQVIEQLLKQK